MVVSALEGGYEDSDEHNNYCSADADYGVEHPNHPRSDFSDFLSDFALRLSEFALPVFKRCSVSFKASDSAPYFCGVNPFGLGLCRHISLLVMRCVFAA